MLEPGFRHGVVQEFKLKATVLHLSLPLYFLLLLQKKIQAEVLKDPAGEYGPRTRNSFADEEKPTGGRARLAVREMPRLLTRGPGRDERGSDYSV